MSLAKAVEAEREYLISLRRDFHRHPELGLHEFRTAQRIEEELDRFGIPHHRVGDTGVYSVIRGSLESSACIAMRADIDALPIHETNEVDYCSQNPGVMHACGHDAHTACLLTAAKVLQQHRASFGGEIRLFFQQAEEIGQGAKQFLNAGTLEGVGRVFGLHTASDLPVGKVGIKPGLNNASVDHFLIRIHGKAAHVSTPHLGVDALYIASQIVVSLQALVTRRTSPVEPVILGIGRMQAGTAYNAVAESAELEGTLRTVSLETRAQMCRQIDEAVHRIADIYGGTVEIVWTDFASPLICDPQVCREVSDTVARIWDKKKVITDRSLSLGGDDFAEFLLQVPGVYAYLGTGNPALPSTLRPAHNGGFDVDEDALVLGAGLYAEYAFWWLNAHRK